MNYQEALARLEGLEVHGIVLGLDRMRRILRAMGDPHSRFRSVHIAGTNGKGSTAAFIASVLREAGLRTGLYTSPHLQRFSERISVSGVEIPPEEFIRYVEEILAVIRSDGSDLGATYFEAATAMAFAHFARMTVDMAVVETGLGGRLDATNVIDPEICVITNVALEHTQYLGNSVKEIAFEKGGIIKKGVDVVTASSSPDALQCLEEICGRTGSRLVRVGREIDAEDVTLDPIDGVKVFHYRGEEHRWEGLAISLPGGFQTKNAALALGALEGLMRRGIQIPETAIRQGLSKARWPGRMEVVSRNPYVILDGAHNPHAVQAILKTLAEELTYERLILVIGILEDKDIPQILVPFLSCSDTVILSKPLYFRGADPQMLLNTIQGESVDAFVKERIPDAIDLALSLQEPGDLVLVTGSLYTVGEAREYLSHRMSALL